MEKNQNYELKMMVMEKKYKKCTFRIKSTMNSSFISAGQGTFASMLHL